MVGGRGEGGEGELKRRGKRSPDMYHPCEKKRLKGEEKKSSWGRKSKKRRNLDADSPQLGLHPFGLGRKKARGKEKRAGGFDNEHRYLILSSSSGSQKKGKKEEKASEGKGKKEAEESRYR